MICSFNNNLETKKHTTYYRNLGVRSESPTLGTAATLAKYVLLPAVCITTVQRLELGARFFYICLSVSTTFYSTKERYAIRITTHVLIQTRMPEQIKCMNPETFPLFEFLYSVPSSDQGFNMLHHLSVQQRVVCIVMCAKMSRHRLKK